MRHVIEIPLLWGRNSKIDTVKPSIIFAECK